MVLTPELEGILKARNQAELYLLDVLINARTDDLESLTGILKELDKIGSIIDDVLMKKEP